MDVELGSQALLRTRDDEWKDIPGVRRAPRERLGAPPLPPWKRPTAIGLIGVQTGNVLPSVARVNISPARPLRQRVSTPGRLRGTRSRSDRSETSTAGVYPSSESLDLAGREGLPDVSRETPERPDVLADPGLVRPVAPTGTAQTGSPKERRKKERQKRGRLAGTPTLRGYSSSQASTLSSTW
jgi:hypothetical protein